MTSTAANFENPTQRGLPSQDEDEIIGYVDPWIASPGEHVAVKVSSTVPQFTWSLTRIIQGYGHPNAPDVKYETISTPTTSSSPIPGSYKAASCGSFAVVEAWERYGRKSIIGLRFSCYVQPWLPDADRQQVLMSTLDVGNFSGVALYLNNSGALGVYVGTGASVEQYETGIHLLRWKWAELCLSITHESVCIDVKHMERLTEVAPGPSQYSRRTDSPVLLDGKKPLTMAAGFSFDTTASAPHATKVFNGRLDSPHIQITRDGVSYITWAKFDFSLDMSSDRVVDTSGNANHGDLINAPTRAVKGFNWDGSEPDWTKARYGYGAIHFHDDDLDDAAWTTDFTLKVPTNAPSGAYAVIVRSVDPSADVSDHITFFVRPATTSSADIAVPKVAIVLSTFTYLAYANEHMYDQSRASRMTLAGGVQVRKDALWRRMARRTDLGCSLYDVHNDGSGCVFSTAKRPILNIRPGYVNWAFHRPREFSADQLMIGFLEEKLGRGGP
ncbi:large subunit of -dimethylformamidase protein [Colletotrichum asianum]